MPPRVPTYDELLNPTLTALHELGGSASIDELVERVVSDLRFPHDIIEQPHAGGGNQSEVQYRLAWARTYLKKYGLIDNSSRGVWSLTPRGLETKQIDPQDVVKAVRAQFVAERRARGEPESETTTLPAAEEAEATPTWHERVLQILLAMPPPSFERLCMRLLRESGFTQVEVTGRTGDGGIDGYGVARVVGFLSFRVSFQCKRYRENVGAPVIRDFRGAMMGRAEKGLILTTSGFTREARAEAARDGATAIDLIDGQLLAEKLKELGLGVRTKMVEAVEVDEEWYAGL